MNRARTAFAVALALLGLAAPTARAAEAWEPVGGAIGPADADPSGFDLKRIAGAPTVAYSHWNGANHEIRVVRFSAGAWQPLGPTVNADPSHEARSPSLAAGPGDVPWIVWTERDDDGIRQIRAARYSESKERFVEPVGGDWPIQPRPPEDYYEPNLFYGLRGQIVFVGSRPHIQMITETPSEYVVGISRLASDRRSWRGVPEPSRTTAPSLFEGSVIGGVLHTLFNSRLGGSGKIDRLGPSGWQQLGGPIVEAGDSYEGGVAQLAALGGEPYVAWNPSFYPPDSGRVARLVDGRWTDVGGGLGGRALDLRYIGGRLWAAHDSGGVRASRLNAEGTAWQASPALAAYEVGVLTGVGGVPHVGWLDTTGRVHVARLTGVAPAGPDDNDGSDPPCPHPDPDITESVVAPPLPAAWPPDEPADSGDTSCPKPGEPGPGPGPHPPGPGPHTGPGPHPGPGPNPAKPGPCGPRLLGTNAADRLTGGAARDDIAGRSGNDTILGLGGDDCLFGNAGDDVLKAGAGADRLEGGSGNDRLVGGDGHDSVKAGPGNDVVDSRGKGYDRIDCGPGRDKALVGDLDRVRNCERVLNVD